MTHSLVAATADSLPNVDWSMEQLWTDLDACDTADAYTHWRRGKDIALLLSKGVTQEVLAERLSRNQPDIAKLRAIGVDGRFDAIIRSTNTPDPVLPRSREVLYELTTLDDDGFAELCKPSTTQAKVREYKHRLNGPKTNWEAEVSKALHAAQDGPGTIAPAESAESPTAPGEADKRLSEGEIRDRLAELEKQAEEQLKADPDVQSADDLKQAMAPPGSEWYAPGQYYRPVKPSEKGTYDWNEEEQRWEERYTRRLPDAREWICSYARTCNEGKLDELLQALRRIVHPDKGGDHEQAAILNGIIQLRRNV